MTPYGTARRLWRLPVLGSVTSSGLGLVRDLVVIWAVASSATSDVIFGCLLWCSAMYALSGSSALVRMSVAAQAAPPGSEARWWAHTTPFGRLATVASLAGVVGAVAVAAAGVYPVDVGHLVLVAVAAGIMVAANSAVDFLNCAANKRLGIGPVQWCTALQNVAVIVGCTALGVLGRAGLISVLLCYALGYVLNLGAVLALLVGHQREHRDPPGPERFTRLPRATAVDLTVASMTALQLGLPLLEQSGLYRMGAGTVTAVALARRLTATVPGVLIRPLGTKFILGAQHQDERILRWLSPALLAALSASAAVAAVVATVHATTQGTLLGGGPLVEATTLLTVAGVAAASTEAGMRWLQGVNDHTSPSLAIGLYAALHLAGVGMSWVTRTPMPALTMCGIGWTASAWFIWRRCDPAAPAHRMASPLPFAALLALQAVVVATSRLPASAVAAVTGGLAVLAGLACLAAVRLAVRGPRSRPAAGTARL